MSAILTHTRIMPHNRPLKEPRIMRKMMTHRTFALLVAFAASALASAFAAAPVAAQSVLKNHDTYQPIDISADRLEMKQKEGRAIFKGTVTVKQGKLTLSSDTLTVFYQAEKGVENPSISRLDAEGHVMLVSDTETLSGEWGVYDVDRRLVTLGGNVAFLQGDAALRGERLEFDLVSGLAKLDGNTSEDGRVRGKFSVPESNSDKSKDGGKP